MKVLISAVALFFGLAMVGVEAEAAKRLGGGKSMGTQRNMTQQAAPKAPAQQQQAQQAGAPAQQPAAAAAQPAGNKWLGPLAGLAMGAGLMALFMNNGIAGALTGLLLAAAIAAVAVLVFRALRNRTAQAPMQYAGHQGAASPEPLTLGGGSAAAPHSVAATATTGRWPADFNAAEFIRHARLNFVRLQEANDKRDSSALADFLTADLLTEIQAQWQSEGAAGGKTDVVTLESEVLDVVSEGLLYVVSVRFSGLIREDGATEAQPFSEIWHLEKPMRGSSGWLVSGIQQA